MEMKVEKLVSWRGDYEWHSKKYKCVDMY